MARSVLLLLVFIIASRFKINHTSLSCDGNCSTVLKIAVQVQGEAILGQNLILATGSVSWLSLYICFSSVCRLVALLAYFVSTPVLAKE